MKRYAILILLLALHMTFAQNPLTREDLEEQRAEELMELFRQLMPQDQPAGTPSRSLAGAAPIETVKCALPDTTWMYGLLGTEIGRAGFVAGDFNQNGRPEIFLESESFLNGSYSSTWQAVEYTGLTWRQTFVFQGYDHSIRRMAKVPSPTQAGEEALMVALLDGTVVFHDLVTYDIVHTLKLPEIFFVRDLQYADINNDGVREFVVNRDSDIVVYSGTAPYAPTRIFAQSVVHQVLVGNLDQDAALEMVSQDLDGNGLVIDGASGEIQWEYPFGFGEYLTLGDVDGDGMEEIIGATRNVNLRVLDADLRNEKWGNFAVTNVDSLNTADLNQDGSAEILLANEQTLQIVSGTGNLEQTITSPIEGFAGVDAMNLDDDAQPELIWGGGTRDTQTSRFFIADQETGTIRWQSQSDDSAYAAAVVGDLTDSGIDELLLVTIDHQFQWYNVNKQTPINRPYPAYDFGTQPLSLHLAEINGTGGEELIIASGTGIYSLDALSGSQRWVNQDELGVPYSSVFSADVNGDQIQEVIVGGTYNYGETDWNQFAVLDGLSGATLWLSPLLGEATKTISDFAVGDFNNDGNPEIAVSLNGGNVFLFDGVTRELLVEIEISASSLAAIDYNQDGITDLMLGSSFGQIIVVDGVNYTAVESERLFIGQLLDIIPQDLEDDGFMELSIAYQDGFGIYDLESLTSVWDGSNCGRRFLQQDQLLIGQFDEDADKELVVIDQDRFTVHDPEYCGINMLRNMAQDWPTGATVLDLLQQLCD